MLELIPKAHFHQERVEWRGKRLLEKMDIDPKELSIKNNDIEIVPYEDLWKEVVSILPKRPVMVV